MTIENKSECTESTLFQKQTIDAVYKNMFGSDNNSESEQTLSAQDILTSQVGTSNSIEIASEQLNGIEKKEADSASQVESDAENKIVTDGEKNITSVCEDNSSTPESLNDTVQVSQETQDDADTPTPESLNDTVQVNEDTQIQLLTDSEPVTDAEFYTDRTTDTDNSVDSNIPIFSKADLIENDDRTAEEMLRDYGFIDAKPVSEKLNAEAISNPSMVSRLTDNLPTSPYQWISLEGMIHEDPVVPDELAEQEIFICQVKKAPWSPNGEYTINPTNRKECVTYQKAASAAKQYYYDGVSIVLSEDDLLCCVDIDHCIEDGNVNPLAWNIVKKINSFTEVSISGTGLHIFLYSSNHLDWVKKKADALGKGIHLETYFYKRHLCFSGHSIEGFEHLRRADKELEEIYNTYMAPTYKKSDDGVISDPPPPMSAEEVLEHLRKEKNGAKFVQALVSGDLSGFDTDDRSSIDFSIISKLCFYTIDPGVIREIMISSPIRRSKWDTIRGNVTYLDYIIAQGLQRCKQHYHPSKKKQNSQQKKPLSLQNYQDDFSFDYGTLTNVELNAIALSEFFGKTISDVACYSPFDKIFFIYNGVIWDTSQQESVMASIAKRFIKHCLFVIDMKIKALEKELESSNNNNEKNADKKAELEKAHVLYNYYKSQSSFGARGKLIADVKNEIAVDHEQFDRDPYLLNLQNGTFNLNTCELQPHRSSDMLTMVAAANYDPNAECPRFLQFIDEVTLNRAEIKRYLQKVCGYLLPGKNELHCMFFFYGKMTRNGKTTLASTIKGALGSYSVTCDVDIITKPSGKGSGSPKPELLQLYKKRFAYFEEPDKYSTLQGSLLKQITGGSHLSARGLYSNSHLEFKCTAKMVISCNNLPRINDLSLIKSDRIKIIPFDKHFSENERDTSLADQFSTPEAMSAILNWLIEGYRLYVSEGLKPFKEMKSLLDSYEYGYDIYTQFIEENLRLRRDNSSNLSDSTVKAVWDVGKKWLKDNNYYVPTRRDFVYELKRAGVEIYRKNNQEYIKGRVLDSEELYNTRCENVSDIQRKTNNDSWHKRPRM